MKNNISQKESFLNGEGDSWFNRNSLLSEFDYKYWIENDPLLPLVLELPCENNSNTKVFEVGMGQGMRLTELKNKRNWNVSGIDPSKKAVDHVRSNQIKSEIGTAEKLPIKDNSIDILIYGFCLYLCDVNDLFLISNEANRVLKKYSWIAIIDFWSSYPFSNVYCHEPTLKSYKMDRTTMFTWHPNYQIYNHKLISHNKNKYTDNMQDWVSVSIIRKNG